MKSLSVSPPHASSYEYSGIGYGLINMKHQHYPLEIDDKDEIDGDQQYCLVWCYTHKKYEWQWIPREDM